MRLALAIALAVAAFAMLAVAALAGQAPPPVLEPQGSSVGSGLGGPPPIAGAVRKAASRANCRVRAFASEGNAHSSGTVRHAQSPATSGTHATRWADWGLYDRPIPMRYLVHNLERGGVVVLHGTKLSAAGQAGVVELLSREPGYGILAPRRTTSLKPAEPGIGVSAFPERGLVVFSWQRRMVCATTRGNVIAALTTYLRTYRGTGPEQVPAINASSRRPRDLPAPASRTPEPR